MRTINANKISKVIAELCKKANINLRVDVLKGLKAAVRKEKNKLSKEMLEMIVVNANIARREKIAICQDTGLPVVFVELGQKVKILGDLNRAIEKGIEEGYTQACLRNSIINDPVSREGKSKFSPPVIHIELNNSDKCRLTVLPKGFGSENKSQIKMFNPTVPLGEIKDFIINAVKEAGPESCPPFIVGVGIGGTQDKASLLAKKALLRPINRRSKKPHIKNLEDDLLKRINKLNIGVMGLGGKITALAVNIEIYPTHIAGLPVAVNICCHALRSASRTI